MEINVVIVALYAGMMCKNMGFPGARRSYGQTGRSRSTKMHLKIHQMTQKKYNVAQKENNYANVVKAEHTTNLCTAEIQY